MSCSRNYDNSDASIKVRICTITILMLTLLELWSVLLLLLTWSTKGCKSLWMRGRKYLIVYVSYLMRHKCVGYLGTIFSIGMMCPGGGFNRFHKVILMVHENGYDDVKCDYKPLKELSIISHDHIIRFDVASMFEKTTSLLLKTNKLSIIYKKTFSDGTLIWY